jgi:iron(III) transport system substrate-binding protein
MVYAITLAVIWLAPGWGFAATLDGSADAARKEAKLVLYTAMQPEDSTKLIDAFKSRYPFIDATFFRAGSAPLLNRILAETRASRFYFDLVSGKNSDLLLLQKKGLLGTLVSSELASYPEQFKDKQNRWVDIYNNYYTIAFNTNHLRSADVPNKWEDLLSPKWSNGKITLDPRSYDWYFGMAAAWGGEKTADYMRKLNQNRPALRDGNVLIANLLAAGEFPIAVTYAHLIERLRIRGAPVEWVALKPMVAVPISIAVSARPLHPNTAKLFVDLALSRQGSELLTAMGRVSTRLDVQPSAKRLDPKGLDLVPLHVSSDEMDPEDFRKIFGSR